MRESCNTSCHHSLNFVQELVRLDVIDKALAAVYSASCEMVYANVGCANPTLLAG